MARFCNSRFSPGQGCFASEAATIRRPRTGRETSRNSANQRVLLINQNRRPEAVSGCLRRSTVWGASIWGTEGPEFKSRQPDKQCAGQVVFLESTVWPVVALGA